MSYKVLVTRCPSCMKNIGACLIERGQEDFLGESVVAAAEYGGELSIISGSAIVTGCSDSCSRKLAESEKQI